MPERLVVAPSACSTPEPKIYDLGRSAHARRTMLDVPVHQLLAAMISKMAPVHHDAMRAVWQAVRVAALLAVVATLLAMLPT